MKKEDKYSTLRQVGLLTTIPLLLAVGPLIGYFIGNFLDRKLETEPYLMIIFIILGFAAAGKETYKLIVKASKENEK